MGCDIHGVVEVFLDGDWQKALSLANISPRNYDLFSLLFGVRGQSPYDYKYRGFPQDMAWYSGYEFCEECTGNGHDEASLERKEQFRKYNPNEKECQHCVDWHSVSWITWQEVQSRWDEIIESTPTLSTGKEDMSRVRMIVWFDN